MPAPRRRRCALCGLGEAAEEGGGAQNDVHGDGGSDGLGALGPLLGPFGTELSLVHRACAIWSPEVYEVRGARRDRHASARPAGCEGPERRAPACARARAIRARLQNKSRPPPRRRLPWRSAHRAGGLYCRARSLADDRLSASGLRAAEPSSLAFPNLFVSRSDAPLLWRRLDGAPSLGQDDAGTLHNIPKAVRRGRQLECTRCGERGATVRAARGAARRCAAPCRTGLQLTPCRTPCRASNGRPTG